MSNRDPQPAKYQVQLTAPGHSFTPASWNCRRDGRPAEASLRRYVESFEASTKPGGVNAHLGQLHGATGHVTVTRAVIMLNDGSRKVVAEYKRQPVGGAMFQLVTEYNI